MEYTSNEKQILALLERTDFKNLSKNDLISYASKLGELRPEVATQVIAQYPELAKLLHSTLQEYRDTIGKIIESDDASIQQVYGILDKELSGAAESRKEYYDLAEKVHADLSKCLDNPNLSEQERREIREQEMELLRMADKKDTEIREQEREVSKTADKKDSEKRQFNWDIIKTASVVVITVVGMGTAALGGNFNIKLPKLKK